MIARALALLCAVAGAARADELSGADKLRVVYSNQFAWTKDGLPLVTVRVADGRSQVVVSAPGVRLLPDGEGGAEVRGGSRWTVRVSGGAPAKVRWHVVVARWKAGDERLAATMKTWKDRGILPHTFETGALFAVRGQVLDGRQVLVTVAPHDDEAGARAEAQKLAAQYSIDTAVHPELVERPRGIVEATDESGLEVRNDGILWFAPGPPSGLLELDEVDKEGGGHERRRYFGKLYVTVDGAGKLAVVNAVPEDKLLAGLVPAEMMPSAPVEALKAQAVAARNELLAKIGTRHLTDPYRLCATQHCQVYAGAGREDARSTAAVQATRGELLEREGGGLVDAVYSASCGGHGEDNDLGWGGAPDASLRGALDADEETAASLREFAKIDDGNLHKWLASTAKPYCARPSSSQASWRWSKPIDLAAAAARAGVGPLTSVTVAERGVSGRAIRLTLTGDGGTKEIRGELEVRRALGSLKSALFELDGKHDAAGKLTELTARGAGHGHGIGMCQLGAVGMAEAGKTYREILSHYYKSSHLKRLY